MRAHAVIFACVFFLTGCATVTTQPEVKAQSAAGTERTKVSLPPEAFNYDSQAYVVSAKKLTRLEKRKLEAIRVNEKEGAGVSIAAIATVASFSALSAYLGKDMNTLQRIGLLGAAAAGAYAVSYGVQCIYEAFNPKIR